MRHRQQLVARGLTAAKPLPRRLGADQDVVEHAQVVGQCKVLVHHADARRQSGLGVARWQRLLINRDMTRVGDVMAEQDGHQGGLAGAVFTQQRQHLAALERQADAVVGHLGAKALGDTAKDQDRVAQGGDITWLTTWAGCRPPSR